MKVLNRYILSEFIKVFGLTITSFIGLNLLVEFIDKSSDLKRTNIPFGEAAEFFLYQIPSTFYQTVPICMLLATLISLGLLSRHNEVTAIKAAGLSVASILRPLLIFALGVSIFTVLLSEYILPITHKRVQSIKHNRLEGKAQGGTFSDGKVWYRDDGTIYSITKIDPVGGTGGGLINGVTIIDVDDRFNLTRKISTTIAWWSGSRWETKEATLLQVEGGVMSKMVTSTEEAEDLLSALPKPEELKRPKGLVSGMSISDLRDYASHLEEGGFNATTYLTDLHNKISFPFVCIILVLLGVPFALKTGRHGGITAGVGISIVVSFTYWIVHAISISLGYSGIIEPVAAAWLANLVFLSLALLLFTYVRN